MKDKSKIKNADSIKDHWKSGPKVFLGDELKFLQWFDHHETKKKNAKRCFTSISVGNEKAYQN